MKDGRKRKGRWDQGKRVEWIKDLDKKSFKTYEMSEDSKKASQKS